MDRIDEWRIFVAVASRRSFTSAARSLGRSPQSVTRAVAALESRLGSRLLNRTTRSVSLTDAGERYLERGRRALVEFDALELAVDTDAPLTGRLSVTAPVLFGQLHVMPVVGRFLEKHPQLDVRLVLVDRVVSLAEEGIDLGVRIGALMDSALRARQVGSVRWVVCASPAYLRKAGIPRTPEALSEHAAVAFTATTPIAERWAFPGPGGKERTVAVRPRLIVNTGQAAIEAALSGIGVARLLSYQVEKLVAQGRLRVLLQSFETPPVPIQLVQLPGAPNRAAVRFAEFAAEMLRARLQASD